MKTAISIPDPLFEAAEELARRAGVSRSEFYAKALAEYVVKSQDDQQEVDVEEAEEITRKLNEVYAVEDSSPDEFLLRAQSLLLPPEEW